MGSENREFILAIALSIMVLVVWQIFIGVPQMEKQQRTTTEVSEQQAGTPTPTAPGAPVPGAPGAGAPSAVPVPGSQPAAPGAPVDERQRRAAEMTSGGRVPIETPSVSGSINLNGARIDDLLLRKYHVTVDRSSPEVTLFAPSGSAKPYYAEHGWSVAPGTPQKVPTSSTVWSAPQDAKLTASTPVTLTWDNGEGLIFRRTISVDDRYMFTIEQSVENTTETAVTLYPYALVSRHGIPDVEDFFVLHEGLIGVLGEDGLIEIDYSDLEDEGERVRTQRSTGGWLGITDKYWGAVVIPDQSAPMTARFSNNPAGAKPIFQTDYLLEGRTVAPGATETVTGRLFAGAKRVEVIDRYAEQGNIEKFDLLIDWGWFYFITKPMFHLIDFMFKLVGNFGVAILLATVVIKLALFPLANKSYVSMSKMKKLQPEMLKIRERYGEDRMKQQQAMMELYKKEKVNPMSGCLPIVVQIPIFFALYKVLFGTIEMRHAPFFGWIQDLAAPDPTSIFNLFGLIPWDPPSFLMIGVWPLLMGVTMFLQMRLNPTPPDPVQAQIFNWMPLFFTFLLATFPAGLVIYWAWNNALSIAQQWVIMRRQGVKVELWDNLKGLFSFGKKPEKGKG